MHFNSIFTKVTKQKRCLSAGWWYINCRGSRSTYFWSHKISSVIKKIGNLTVWVPNTGTLDQGWIGYPVTGLSGSGNKKIPDIWCPDNPATVQLTGPIQLYTGRITLMKFTFPPLLRHLRSGILLWSFDFSYREKDLKDLRLKRRLKGEKIYFFPWIFVYKL